MKKRLAPRKILVASVGLATVSYALLSGCGGEISRPPHSGNLMPPHRPDVLAPDAGEAPPPSDTDASVAPVATGDAGSAEPTKPSDAGAKALDASVRPPLVKAPPDPRITSGNLMAPTDRPPVKPAPKPPQKK